MNPSKKPRTRQTAAAAVVAVVLLAAATLLWIPDRSSAPAPGPEPLRGPGESVAAGPDTPLALEAAVPTAAPAAATRLDPTAPASTEPESVAAGPTCLLTLRVTDAGGRPLVATVTARPSVERDPAPAPGVTTADGEWQARIPLSEVQRGWYVQAEAPGHQPGSLRVPFLPEGRLDLGTLRLARSVRLEGRVLDALGVPLAGARVQARGLLRSVSHRAVRALSHVTDSDDRGRFVIDLTETPPQYDLAVLAWHADHGGPFQELLGVPADGALAPVTVRFGASSSVSGSVVRRDGTPLPGVTLSAEIPPQFALRDVVTDTSGRFTLPLAEGHKVSLSYHGEGLVRLDTSPLSVGAPTRDLQLVMVLESWLRLDVRDALDGTPVPQPSLSFCSNAWGYGRCHKARGENGWIEAGELPPGHWNSLVVSAPGYLPEVVPEQLVSEGQVVGPLLVRMMPRTAEAAVRGRVADDRGQAVAGAVVSALVSQASGPGSSATTTSGPDGSFLIDPLQPGDLTLLARDDLGRQAEPLTGALTSAGWSDVLLVLEPPATVEGHVWLSAQQPASGALVLLSPSGPEGPTSPARVSTVTDEQGRFRIAARPGRYQLKAWQRLPTQPVAVESPLVLVELAAGEQRWLDVPLTLPTLTVRGRLLGDQPTDGWSVSWRYAGNLIETDWRHVLVQAHESSVDPDGGYLLEGVWPGIYSVTVRRADESVVTTEELRVETSLEPAVTIDIRVPDGGG